MLGSHADRSAPMAEVTRRCDNDHTSLRNGLWGLHVCTGLAEVASSTTCLGSDSRGTVPCQPPTRRVPPPAKRLRPVNGGEHVPDRRIGKVQVSSRDRQVIL